MSLFTKKNKDKNILIFDIGSGSVGGAYVKIPFEKNKLPVILKTTRTEIIFKNEMDTNKLIKVLSKYNINKILILFLFFFCTLFFFFFLLFFYFI